MFEFSRWHGSLEHSARTRAEDDLLIVATVIIAANTVTLQCEKAVEGSAVQDIAVGIVHMLVLLSSGATAFVFFEHIRKTSGVVVSALQSLPVTAVASALIVSRLDVMVASRLDIVGSRGGERCHGLSAAGGSAGNWRRRHTHTVASGMLTLTGDISCGVVLFGRNETGILVGSTASVAVDDRTALSIAAYNTVLVNLILGALGRVWFIWRARAQIVGALGCLRDRSSGTCSTTSRRVVEVNLARRLLVEELRLITGCTNVGGVAGLNDRASGSDIGRKRWDLRRRHVTALLAGWNGSTSSWSGSRSTAREVRLASIILELLHVRLMVNLLASSSRLGKGISVGGRWLILLVLDVRNNRLVFLLSVVCLWRLLRSGLLILRATANADASGGATLVVLVTGSVHGDDLDTSDVGRDSLTKVVHDLGILGFHFTQTLPSASGFGFGDVQFSAVFIRTILLRKVCLADLFDLALVTVLEATFRIDQTLKIGAGFLPLLLLSLRFVEPALELALRAGTKALQLDQSMEQIGSGSWQILDLALHSWGRRESAT
jgi:hypothetical protein